MCKEYCGHGGHCGHDGHVGHIDHGGLGVHSGYGQDRTGQDRTGGLQLSQFLPCLFILSIVVFVSRSR